MNQVSNIRNNQYLLPTEKHKHEFAKSNLNLKEIYHMIENNARRFANALQVPTINKNDEEIALALIEKINKIFESGISEN